MKSRILFAVLAVAIGAVCVRLGIWQLDRLRERRARNAVVAERMTRPPVDIATLRGDTAELRFRRATIRGVADYANELVLGGRSRGGSPGVNLLTPVRVPGRDTAFLVNRGWVYSPDAASGPAESPAEADTVAFEGHVEFLGAGDAVPVNPQRPRSVPRPVLASARARLPYPVAAIYLVAHDAPDPALARVPARLTVPSVTDEGSHRSYAFQWFIFATVAFAGAGLALRSRETS